MGNSTFDEPLAHFGVGVANSLARVAIPGATLYGEDAMVLTAVRVAPSIVK